MTFYYFCIRIQKKWPMKNKYPFIEITKYGDFPSAVIHLGEDSSTLALPSQNSLIETMNNLVKSGKLTKYHFYEFLKTAMMENMLKEIYNDDEDELHFELDDLLRKIILKKITENPYSLNPCIRKIEGIPVRWFVSTSNNYSNPFTNKKEGKKEIGKMLNEKDAKSFELEEVLKLLFHSKEIPGDFDEKNEKVN